MNKHIQKLIKEQFSASDLDFTDTEPEYDNIIFNKQPVNPHDVYNEIVNSEDANEFEIEYINDLVSEVVPKDYEALHKITDFYSANYPEYSLNWLDVSGITSMSSLFSGEPAVNGDNEHDDIYNNYNGDISKWDVSNVTNMSKMFMVSKFNGDISNWDVHNVWNMSAMFKDNNSFNQDISKWDVHNVLDMSAMFSNTRFNGDISKWDVSGVQDMSHMFQYSLFNNNISRWNVSNVTNMNSMFDEAYRFNQNISKWDVSNVTDMNNMFNRTPFNQNISKWNVSNVDTFYGIFHNNNKMNKKYIPAAFIHNRYGMYYICD